MYTQELIPNAAHLIESLRDIGYTLGTAVADIIDNSISAQAKELRIFTDGQSLQEFKLAILDDGTAMPQEKLIEAMRLGSQSPKEMRNNNDLGRFGLGLKTASFSQCRRLTVISKPSATEVYAARWDLDNISQSNQWDLEILSEEEIQTCYKFDEMRDHGVLVLWEKNDRISDTTTTSFHAAYAAELEQVKEHLRWVFHRFMVSENNEKPLKIYLNYQELEPLDPFNKSSPATQQLVEEVISIRDSKIRVRPYILPHHYHYQGKKAGGYEYYAGAEGYVKNQGFYIYRNKRLLLWGTWFRLAPQAELSKLARVQIDFTNELDDLWQIDVKKSTARPPDALRERLRSIISKLINPSKRVFNGRSEISITQPFWNRRRANGETSYRINTGHPLVNDFTESLNDGQKKQFSKLLEYIAEYIPKDQIFSDYGENTTQFHQGLDDAELEQIARNKWERCKDIMSEEQFIALLESMQPTSSYKNWKPFVETKL